MNRPEPTSARHPDADVAKCDRGVPPRSASAAAFSRTLVALHRFAWGLAMNQTARTAWVGMLDTLGDGGQAEPADCADMGTAFGLDASIDAAFPAQHGAGDEAVAPPAWQHRLVRRSGL
jgi:hypothetical protein